MDKTYLTTPISAGQFDWKMYAGSNSETSALPGNVKKDGC